MYISIDEKQMLQAIYDYSRVPIWIFNEDLSVEDSYFSDTIPKLKDILSSHFKSIISEASELDFDFDILCYKNELYYMFRINRRNRTFWVLGGPMLLSGFYHVTDIKQLSFADKLDSDTLGSIDEIIPVVSFTSFSSCLRLVMLALKKKPLSPDEIGDYKFFDLQGTLDRTFIRELFENTEDYQIHTPYSHEIALLNCVKEGNLERLESTYRTLPQIKYGNMSKNPFRQLLYGCIANTTLITRFAIEGGLDEETAFTLSDVYIRQMENCTTLYELDLLNEKMAVDFTQRVAELKASKINSYSKAVKMCIDYIHKNNHNKISLEMLANNVNLTPKYLSALFNKETGQTISAYIERSRINEAKNLLVFSAYSYSQICQSLSFCSQSYFISVFKKNIGITPKEYREKYAKINL